MSEKHHSAGKALSIKILIGMGLGIAVGLICNLFLMDVGWIANGFVDGLLGTIGAMFIDGLQMLVVPLVFVSLFCGASALSDPNKLGRLSIKTIGLYLLTTAVAISLALAAATVFKPGAGVERQSDLSFTAQEAPGLKEVIVNIVPENPIEAMASGNMLPIILFAILLGFAAAMSGEPGKRVRNFFEDLNSVIMRLVMVVMALAPYGVFALITETVATTGWGAIKGLIGYFVLVLVVLFVHALVTYPLLLSLLGKLNPLTFLRKMRATQLFAFSTASSNATIPITLSTVRKRLGVGETTASFTVPLGATINMDGTAIMQGVATVFIAQAYGIDLGLTQMLTVVLMATMASIGTAGVPGVGLILLATVLQQVNLPVEGIAMIIGIDRILDMTRTAVNITGDATVSCLVGRSEGDLDEAVFNDPDAGTQSDAA